MQQIIKKMHVKISICTKCVKKRIKIIFPFLRYFNSGIKTKVPEMIMDSIKDRQYVRSC